MSKPGFCHFCSQNLSKGFIICHKLYKQYAGNLFSLEKTKLYQQENMRDDMQKLCRNYAGKCAGRYAGKYAGNMK